VGIRRAGSGGPMTAFRASPRSRTERPPNRRTDEDRVVDREFQTPATRSLRASMRQKCGWPRLGLRPTRSNPRLRNMRRRARLCPTGGAQRRPAHARAGAHIPHTIDGRAHALEATPNRDVRPADARLATSSSRTWSTSRLFALGGTGRGTAIPKSCVTDQNECNEDRPARRRTAYRVVVNLGRRTALRARHPGHPCVRTPTARYFEVDVAKTAPRGRGGGGPDLPPLSNRRDAAGGAGWARNARDMVRIHRRESALARDQRATGRRRYIAVGSKRPQTTLRLQPRDERRGIATLFGLESRNSPRKRALWRDVAAAARAPGRFAPRLSLGEADPLGWWRCLQAPSAGALRRDARP